MQPLGEETRRRAKAANPDLSDDELDEYDRLAARRIQRLARHGGVDPEVRGLRALGADADGVADEEARLEKLFRKVFRGG